MLSSQNMLILYRPVCSIGTTNCVKLRYFDLVQYVCSLKVEDGGLLVTSCSLHNVNDTQLRL